MIETPTTTTTSVLPDAADLWSKGARTTRWQRVTQFAFTRIVIGFVLGSLLGGFEYLGLRESNPEPVRIAAAVAITFVYICAVFGLARVLERRHPFELAFGLAPFEWLMGLALGVLLLASTVAVLVGLGAYGVRGGGSPQALLEGVVLFVPHALLEELIFRIVLFKVAEEALGTWAAIAIEAVLFGFVHGSNPGATVVGTVAIAVEAGILLAMAYAYTRRIWLVWGLHVGWNYAQGSVFGINVSGLKVSSLLVSRATGADWLTGGAFGVEASPVAVVLCVVAAFFLLRAAQRRGQIVGYRTQRERVRQLLLRQLDVQM